MKVLIVDDEKHVREGIKLLGEWEQNGITEIYEACNGEEAIELIQTLRPEIIFSDMKMPKMDGLEATRIIKKRFPERPFIIAMTANALQSDLQICIDAGMDDYISKPFKLDDLVKKLVK